jgi:DNA polymerase I-like protein with 3'-5' exonuclease and polymerase domains
MSTKELKQANAKLLDEGSGQKTNKGLFDTVLSVFDFGKAEHQMLLFFGVLGLEPISHTKTGKPQVNVSFIKAYKRDNVIVEKFGKLVKLKKLWSTYVKGWWNKIQDSPDSKLDWILRAAYGFFDVVTGRLNSMKPSLQQVPSRGPEAKYIKRSFRAPPGHVHVKFDYSAHEVRVWSMISFDLVLASVFKVGQELRRKLRRTVDPAKVAEIFAELKKKGDVHIQNVKRFFDMWVDKEHPLRDAIKSVVFGVIYQKSAKSLAKDIRTTAKNNLDDKKYALKNELKANPAPTKARALEIKDALLKLKPDYVELAGDDKVKLAKDIMTKMFAEFKKGAAWLEWSKAHAEKNYYTYSPIGVRRNLFGVMTGINGIVAGLLRRAANSPVQGLASMIGVTGSRLVVVEMWDVLTKFGFMDENTEVMPVDILKQVHDAQYSEVPYEIMLIFIHVMQWTVTYGVTKHYKDVYNFEFTVEPEIEVEIGATEDKHYKWNWTNINLLEIVNKTLDDQVALKDLDAESRKEAETKIWAIYEDPKYKKIRRYLHTNYPILGVVPEEYK